MPMPTQFSPCWMGLVRRQLCLHMYDNQVTTCCLWLQGDIIGVGIRTTGEVIASPADEDVHGRGVQHVLDGVQRGK